MGHSVHVEMFTVEEAERIRNQGGVDHYGRQVPFARKMVREAVSRWLDEGYGDERSGTGHLAEAMSEDAARQFINDNYRLVAEQSVVIPIIAEDDLKVTRKKITLEFTPEHMAKSRADVSEWARNDLVREELTGRGLGHVRIKSVEFGKRRKPVARATEGALVTMYQLVPKAHGPHAPRPTPLVVDGRTHFATMSEARAVGAHAMEQDPTIAHLDVVATQHRVTDNGASNVLATITRPDTVVKLQIEFDQVQVKANSKPAEYLVAFDYHH